MAGALARTRAQRPLSARRVGTARTSVAPETRNRTMAPELQPSTSRDLANGPLLPNVAAEASASHRPRPGWRPCRLVVLVIAHPVVMSKTSYTDDANEGRVRS